MSLARFDGKRFAVSFLIGGQPRVAEGVARYEIDAVLGANLAIRIQESDDCSTDDTVVHIQEGQWKGEIQASNRFGCDYCIEIALPWEPTLN